MMISFESLRDFQRKEREDKNLVQLPASFYPACSESIKKLSERTKDTSSIMELENMKKAFEDILEIREKKMILMALHSARGSAAPKNLLPEEKDFFEKSLENILSLRKGLAKDVIDGRLEFKEEPIVEKTIPHQLPPKAEEKKIEIKLPVTNIVAEKIHEIHQTIHEPSRSVTMESLLVKETSSGRMSVMFMKELPRFMGTDERAYGPVKEGDILDIPKDVAEFLIGKGAAKKT